MIESGRLPYAPRASGEDDARVPRETSSRRFRRMAEEHIDFLWRSLRRLGVPEPLVDDAVQQVFWTAHRRIDDIHDGRERQFLFGTAVNVAADVRRRLARAREHGDERALDEAADSAPTPDEIIHEKQARALLDEVLDGMDEDLRVVFLLFEIEGMTSPEIAELVGVPLGTVASRLRRSREQFHAIAKRARARALRCGGGS